MTFALYETVASTCPVSLTSDDVWLFALDSVEGLLHRVYNSHRLLSLQYGVLLVISVSYRQPSFRLHSIVLLGLIVIIQYRHNIRLSEFVSLKLNKGVTIRLWYGCGCAFARKRTKEATR